MTEQLAIATTTSIRVFTLSGEDGQTRDVTQSASIPLPQIGSDPVTFRSARFVSRHSHVS
jgi:hypothetical protein